LDDEIDNPDILKRRNLLCKDEVLALEEGIFSGAVLIEVNGYPFWKLVPRDQKNKVRYVQARIISPQFSIKKVISS